tara:strand:- start:1364 stop:2209 length:846 start_codon:yes stop_codon:yes gene_type:complete
MKTLTKIKFAKFVFYLIKLFGIKQQRISKRNSINWCLDLSEAIDLSIFLTGSFQGDIVKSIIKLIIKKKFYNQKINIIDIGSNIGDKSLSLCQNLINQKINNFKIYSIEPTEYAFQKQTQNLNLNPILKKKIQLSKFYVLNDKKKINKVYASWKLNTVSNDHKIHQGIFKNINKNTKNISLDKFIDKNKIKKLIILKIDTDGFEMEILKSCIKYIKKHNVIIFMEYAPYLIKEQGSNEKDFYNFVNKNGFFIYDLKFNPISSIRVGKGSTTEILLIKNKLT